MTEFSGMSLEEQSCILKNLQECLCELRKLLEQKNCEILKLKQSLSEKENENIKFIKNSQSKLQILTEEYKKDKNFIIRQYEMIIEQKNDLWKKRICIKSDFLTKMSEKIKKCEAKADKECSPIEILRKNQCSSPIKPKLELKLYPIINKSLQVCKNKSFSNLSLQKSKISAPVPQKPKKH